MMVEDDPLGRQAVEVRRLDPAVAVGAEEAQVQAVADDDDDVRGPDGKSPLFSGLFLRKPGNRVPGCRPGRQPTVRARGTRRSALPAIPAPFAGPAASLRWGAGWTAFRPRGKPEGRRTRRRRGGDAAVLTFRRTFRERSPGPGPRSAPWPPCLRAEGSRPVGPGAPQGARLRKRLRNAGPVGRSPRITASTSATGTVGPISPSRKLDRGAGLRGRPDPRCASIRHSEGGTQRVGGAVQGWQTTQRADRRAVQDRGRGDQPAN